MILKTFYLIFIVQGHYIVSQISFWKNLKVAADLGQDLEVCTGGTGVPTLPGAANAMPVPKFIWKLIRQGDIGVVIIAVNNPHADFDPATFDTMIPDPTGLIGYKLCPNLVSNWFLPANTIEKGFLYACSVETAALAIPKLSQSKVAGMEEEVLDPATFYQPSVSLVEDVLRLLKCRFRDLP